jgi:hypothetical protein
MVLAFPMSASLTLPVPSIITEVSVVCPWHGAIFSASLAKTKDLSALTVNQELALISDQLSGTPSGNPGW